MTDNPIQLRALAGEMDDVAGQVRELSGDLLGVRDALAWRSVAATEYRESLGERAATSARSADLVDDLAHSLRRHAESVEQAEAAIAAARSFLLGALEDARMVLADLWDGLIDTITPGVEHAERIFAISAQTPGSDTDPAWLDLARAAGWRG